MPRQAVRVLREQPDIIHQSVVTVGSHVGLLPERTHQTVKSRL
jgi:hypothetical protein